MPIPRLHFRRVFASLLVLGSAVILGPANAQAQIPAFPGAEGFGGYAKGGRGGDVYIVTNLNASGLGSFADAIATVPSAGRTIVFAVSGYIHLPTGKELRMTASKVTIAGQTAPGDGIGFKDGTFRISGDDVIVRHARFRFRKGAGGGDCVDLDSGSLNSVLDHVSLEFSTDENISSFSSPPENLTMQWSLNAWGLESHSCGGLWDQNHATCHHSLWAHNHTRNPKARPSGLLDWVNNVTFDWDIGFIMGDSETPATWKANVRNCYFLSPAGNLHTKALEKANLDRNGTPNFSLYLNNCRHDADGDGLLNGTDKGYGIASGSYLTLASPVAATGAVAVTMDDPTVAFKKIVSAGGALRLDLDPAKPLRDEVDTILINDLVTQTRRHVSNESQTGAGNGGIGTLASTAAPTDTDKDGMPDYYETALGWNLGAQDHNTALPSAGGVISGTTFFPTGTPAGYTRLEEYLHFLAIPHGMVAKNVSGSPTSVQVDLRKFTSGFSASPVFTVANAIGGAVTQSGMGGFLATFTPTVNYTGRARFEFTVTDAAGHNWTQTCALIVTNTALPRDLIWKGDGSLNYWNYSDANWNRNGAATAFSSGDRVTFDDTGSQAPAVAIQGTQATPSSMLVDTAGTYTFSNSAILEAGNGGFIKRGSGTVSILSGMTFGVATLEAGTFSTNQALDVGTFQLNAGTFAFSASQSGVLAVNGDVGINVSGTRESTGAWTGAGTANVSITGANTFTLRGNTSAYTGRINLGASTGFLRLYGSLGSAAAAFDLGTSTADLLNRDGNATIDLGSLEGGAGTTLSGAGSANAPTTYNLGALSRDTTFAGAITNGGGGAAATTSIHKVGAGILTFSGASTYTGATTITAGQLAVNGSLGATATTVASASTLSGSGSIGGAVTVQNGGRVSPGRPVIGAEAGTLALGGNFTVDTPTFYFDLSGTPGGNNDHITMAGGTLGMTGALTFQFNLLNGTLGAGTYDLITGATNSTASGVTFPHNLPTGTRQTFSIFRPAAGANPSFVKMTVTGNAATLTWTGAASGAWDTVTAGNWTGGAPSTFFNFDAVVFDETGPGGTITLANDVQPRTVLINTTAKTYTFSGASIGGAAALTKTGPGTLILNATNHYTGGTLISGGVVQLASEIATDTTLGGALGLAAGGGTITLAGGTLKMFRDDNSYTTFDYNFVVPAGQTGTLEADDRCDLHGTLSGGGTLNLFVPWIRTTLLGDWSAFTGVINVTTDADGGDFRIGASYATNGYPQAAIVLSSKVTLQHTGTLAGGEGTTISIGELSGPGTAHVRGGVTGGRSLTYRIGTRNTDATFSGDLAEQNIGTTTALVKTGTGTWTLAGPCTHRGATMVEAGTLRFTGTGSLDNDSPLSVASGATLALQGGTLNVDSVNLAANSQMTCTGGAITGDFNNDGTVTVSTGTLTVNGDLVNNGTLRITGGALLNTSGAVVNNGILDLLTSPSNLPFGLVNQGIVIENSARRILSASKAGNNFTITAWGYSGHTYLLERAGSLSGPWTGVGTLQTGTGSLLTFTDFGGATGPQRYYRLAVAP